MISKQDETLPWHCTDYSLQSNALTHIQVALDVSMLRLCRVNAHGLTKDGMRTPLRGVQSHNQCTEPRLDGL
jgi:hypothetical protein